MGIDAQKVLVAGFTGLRTCAGDLLTVKFKYEKLAAVGAINAQRIANWIHIVPHLGRIIEMHDIGVCVFDRHCGFHFVQIAYRYNSIMPVSLPFAQTL